MKMKGTNLKYLIAFIVVVAVLICAGVTSSVWGQSTHMTDCPECEGSGVIETEACDECGGSGKLPEASNLYATFWALVPPIIAIALALITKEVYSSLFIGIFVAAIFYSNFNFVGTFDSLISDGFISSVADPWNAGIYIFLVLLGVMVSLVNLSGGARAFGNWAEKNIKTRAGALFAVFVLGVLIFIDDYFNCLTVGSVMTPVTDRHKVSRAKLAYLIDATAAPVCMIAPISSWAAAVSGVAADTGGMYSGIQLFCMAIPYNFYSILTFVFVIGTIVMNFDYGPMKLAEMNALINGELGAIKTSESEEETTDGKVLDLIIPIAVLIVLCIIGMIYVGGFFSGADFITAFGETDASVGLPLGAIVALIFTIIYLMVRRTITFKQAMEAIPNGFTAMVPAILILTFALSLKGLTGLLGADVFVKTAMENAAEGLSNFLPAVIFIVACLLAFSTGTSWGTFGILIPIVTALFAPESTLYIIGISACLAGAVCGDHCSPISDTTIMASAGAKCDHVSHVSTQLPYALTVAAVSFVSYIIAGLIQNIFIVLPIAIALMIITLFVIKKLFSTIK